MAISFISGKPGGGKTLLGTKYAINELVDGQRLVATNLPLNLPRLNEYIQQKYPDASVDLFKRLRVLSEDEVKEFWKYRTLDGIEDKGCLFVLDEIHLFFNARKWMETGEDCLHYLSQHRKLADDVICITQHVENVDKQFRSVAQDFTVVVNGYKQRVGSFRGLPCFTRKTYSSSPNGGEKQQPFEVARFTLDKDGIASCYDTAAGIGVHGRDADKTKKPKGLHPALFVVGVIALIGLVFFGVKSAMGFVIGKANSAMASIKEAQGKTDVPQSSAASKVDAKQAEGVGPAAQAVPLPSPPSQQRSRLAGMDGVADRPVVEGRLIGGGRVRVILSDGRVLEADSEELEEVRRNRVKISGEWVYYKRPQSHGNWVPPSVAASAPSVAVSEDKEVEPLPPPPTTESAWQMHSDGVQRLKQTETMATAFAR